MRGGRVAKLRLDFEDVQCTPNRFVFPIAKFFYLLVTVCFFILAQVIRNKKSPQIVGLGPPMCSHIFWPVNFNANQLNILVYLPLL